jgi:primase-polymerase (primpol)-like protein
MGFNDISAELKPLRQFVNWRYELPPNAKPQDRPKKAPYHPKVFRASPTNPETWSIFQTVIDAVNRPNFQFFSGIGFVFTENDPYCGIDLDERNEVTQWVFDNFISYTEYSPSGKGLHIIIKASVPKGRKRYGAEIYSSGRFFTMTGNVYPGRNIPIADYSELALTLYDKLAGTVSKSIVVPRCDFFCVSKIDYANRWAGLINAAPETRFDDDKVKYRVQNSKWGAQNCDLANANFPRGSDYSAKEQSFCNTLVKWFTKDPDQIERIWLSTILGSRWKTQTRIDYRTETIRKAYDKESILPPQPNIDWSQWGKR